MNSNKKQPRQRPPQQPSDDGPSTVCASHVHVQRQPAFAACVGIDWADKQHALVLQAHDRPTPEPATLDQTPEALDAWATQLLTRFHGQPVAVALEQSRGALIYALMKYPHLTLYPVPPARLSNYRKAFVSSGAKDDPTDAALLLDYLLKHRQQLRPVQPDDPQIRRLRLLVEKRRAFVEQRTALSNQLTDLLKQYFPQALDWAGDKIYSRMACNFLIRWPDLVRLQRAKPQTLRSFYYAHNLRRSDLIEQRIKAITLAKPLIDDAPIIDVSRQAVQALAKLLRQLADVIAGFDKQIQKVFADHQDAALFAQLPGAGKALAPRLLCAWGADRQRFANAAEMQVFAGIAPVTRRSGKQHHVHRRWAASTFLRQTFHEFAQHSIGQSAWAKAYYMLQINRGKKHHAAVRALAFKWIRILCACWKTRTAYNEAHHQNQLRRRQSPLITHLPAT